MLVNILNMMVTETGLLDQMLTQIIVYEEPKLMDKKDTAIKVSAENNKKKSELEDTILNQIATSEVDILENDVRGDTVVVLCVPEARTAVARMFKERAL